MYCRMEDEPDAPPEASPEAEAPASSEASPETLSPDASPEAKAERLRAMHSARTNARIFRILFMRMLLSSCVPFLPRRVGGASLLLIINTAGRFFNTVKQKSVRQNGFLTDAVDSCL